MPAQDLRDGVEVLAVEDAAGGILRRVEDQQARLRRDLRLELGRIEREPARLAQEDRHRHRAVGGDLRLVDRKAGHRVDHLVADAEIGDRRDRVRDEGLGARADHDVVGGDREAAARAQVLRRGGPQLVDARAGRVAMLAALDRRDGRLLHVRRRREIRLADAEGHDVLALPDQRIHFRQHDERVLGAERLRAARQPRHGQIGAVRRVHRAPLRAAYRSRNVRPGGAGMSRSSVQPLPSGKLADHPVGAGEPAQEAHAEAGSRTRRAPAAGRTTPTA